MSDIKLPEAEHIQAEQEARAEDTGRMTVIAWALAAWFAIAVFGGLAVVS